MSHEISISIAEVKINFKSNEKEDIEAVEEIFSYHLVDKSVPSLFVHNVEIIERQDKLLLPNDLVRIWSGFVNTTMPIVWYNQASTKTSFIQIGNDILIKHFDDQNYTLCELYEFSGGLFKKRKRPKLTIYLLFLIHSITSMYDRFCLHACCLSKDGNALVFLGKSGAGKSTLSLMLGKKGFEYMGDDLVFVSDEGEQGLMIHSFVSKAKLLNSYSSTKRSIDIVKKNDLKYCFKSKLKSIIKLTPDHYKKDSLLTPESCDNVIGWLLTSSNNIAIQKNTDHWLELCYKASTTIPAYNLLFGDKNAFDYSLIDNLYV